VDPAYGGPEYETLASLGSDCGVDNLKAVARGNQRCGANSLDTISTGSVIAFAMECFENGLLTKEDTGGIDLRFGNDEAMLQVIDLIARKEGIGALLAEGTVRAAKKIGKGAEAFAIQVKGLETGMHDPRTKVGLGLGYMVNPHGGDHCLGIRDFLVADEVLMKPLHPMGYFDPVPIMDIGPRKVGLFKVAQSASILDDSMVTCVIVPVSLQKKADTLAAITGWDTSTAELLRVAERVLTVARLYNIREGFTADDDNMPQRFYESKTDGVLADKKISKAEFDNARNFYYALMGWDSKGVPLPEKIIELDIE
jgi:aldehyde:ferredoxin oxidoreductase